MIKVYDFRCDNGHVYEQFVDSGTEMSRCKEYGASATKMLSAPAFILDGHTGDFPGRHMKWVKEHEQAGRSNSSP